MADHEAPLSTLASIGSPKFLTHEDRLPVTTRAIRFHLDQYVIVKDEVNSLSAEIQQRTDQIDFLNGMISEFNSYIDTTKDRVDLSGRENFLEKMRIAEEELGVLLPKLTNTVNQAEQSLLLNNLNLAIQGLDRKNKSTLNRIEGRTKHLEYIFMILKSCEKADNQAKLAFIRGIKGS